MRYQYHHSYYLILIDIHVLDVCCCASFHRRKVAIPGTIKPSNLLHTKTILLPCVLFYRELWEQLFRCSDSKIQDTKKHLTETNTSSKGIFNDQRVVQSKGAQGASSLLTYQTISGAGVPSARQWRIIFFPILVYTTSSEVWTNRGGAWTSKWYQLPVIFRLFAGAGLRLRKNTRQLYHPRSASRIFVMLSDAWP